MRLTTLALTLAVLPLAAPAQDATIVVPEGNFGNYDPTLSAKEAVLANWEMAASGIRAGEVLGERVVALADEGAAFDVLKARAAFAQKTMLARYHAASWTYVDAPDRARVSDETLRAVVAATAAECATEACSAEAATIRAAFAQGAEELGVAAAAARAAITERQGRVDAALMTEQLGMMAEYLDSGAWAEDLVLTEFGMDSSVVADRIVGTIALWRNVEPYVGLTNPEIDDAINAGAQTLLRTLRSETRDMPRLEPEGEVAARLTEAAQALAADLRRAAGLFAS